MKGAKRTPLSARKKPKKTNTRLVRSIVTYLKSDAYLFAPLFSKFSPLSPHTQMPPPSKADVSVKKNKTRMSEKVKEYLNSDCYMYRPMISLPKPGSALKGFEAGKLQITNLVTMEVSKSSATMRGDNNYRCLRSDIAQHARIRSPKRAVVILEGQGTGLSHETDLSPAFSSLPEGKDGAATLIKESSD